MNKQKVIKVLIVLHVTVIISVALIILGAITYLYLTDFKSLQNIDPRPRDFSTNVVDAKKESILISEYLAENQIYDFKDYKISINEAWVESFSDEQSDFRIYDGNYKMIISFDRIEEKISNAPFLSWKLDINEYAEQCGNLNDGGHLIFRFDTLPKKTSMFLHVFLCDSVQNEEYSDSIKLIKKIKKGRSKKI